MESQKSTRMHHCIFKSKAPVSLFIVPGFALLTYILSIKNTHEILASILFPIIITSLGYYFLLKGNYYLEIYRKHLLLRNLLKKNKRQLDFDEIVAYDCYRSTFNLFSTKVRSNLVTHPYDTLFLMIVTGNKVETIELQLNFRVFQFSKLIKTIEKEFPQVKKGIDEINREIAIIID